ncbi:DUF192 domain-containing protein [Thermopolyspora sp. NPDC052614]|uniref:DUF192 domain-containing protein n=1 Tax=Thermopolyspora sp. NPDC052614 TaxID=3155682 RepID=UPI0034473139
MMKRRHLRLAAALAILSLLAGCSGPWWVSVRPLNLPIEFTLNSEGEFEVSFSISTPPNPLGQIEIGGEETLAEVGDDETLIVIEHQVGNRRVEDRFTADGRGSRQDDGAGGGPVGYCLAGTFYLGQDAEGVIRIVALNSASRVKLVSAAAGASACGASEPTTPPHPSATAEPSETESPETEPSEISDSEDPGGLPTRRIQLLGRSFVVALAVTDEAISTGMSGWDLGDLRGLDGMLYAFDTPREPGQSYFSTSGYRFPVDILFFDSNGFFLGGVSAPPCPQGANCRQYYPAQPFQYVIETPSGHLPMLGRGTRLLIQS